MRNLTFICFIPFLFSCSGNESDTSANQISLKDTSEIINQDFPQTLPRNRNTTLSEASEPTPTQAPAEKVKTAKVHQNEPKQTEEIISRMSLRYPDNLFLYPDKDWLKMSVDEKKDFLISERISLELSSPEAALSNGIRYNEIPDAVEFVVRFYKDKDEVEERHTVIRKPGERYIKISDSDGVCGPMFRPIDPREFEYEVAK